MSEVKRYTMAAAYAGPVVALDDKGQQFTNYDEHLPPFVLASDYDALLADRDRLAAELSAARAALASYARLTDGGAMDLTDSPKSLVAALRRLALSAPASLPEGE